MGEFKHTPDARGVVMVIGAGSETDFEQDAPDTLENDQKPRRSNSQSGGCEAFCGRSILLWLIASCGTGLTIGVILVITWAAQPKAMRSTQSHNFISINPIQTTNPTPNTYLDDYSSSVIPVPVHSHNDYWRPHPLYSALAAGCMGVEADVWLTPDGNDLYVGHHPGELSSSRTLQTLYLNPLKEILDKLNAANVSGISGGPRGVFKTAPETTLILLIDVKGNATQIWPVVSKQLEPLRNSGYLSTLEYNNGTSASNTNPKTAFKQGPITVVASGNIDKSNVTGVGCDALTRYTDTFLDAPLDALLDDSNSGTLQDCQVDSLLGQPLAKFYTASAPFIRSFGPFSTTLTESQKDTVGKSLEVAAAKNLTSRYWSLPAWPISRRDYVWQFLVDKGIGLLNADDIESATRLEWNKAYKAELIYIGVSSAYIFVASLVFAYLYERSNKRPKTSETGKQAA